ncbi:MAG: M2 family metallopeptidase, partial [Planctomycetales bacterium]|nr:M2 family metallopeptidase [Planctomycetales bacterium]
MKIPALFTSTVLCTLSACSHTPSTDPGASKESELTAESGKAFVERTNDELREIWVEAGRAEWVKSTYITDDTEALAAKANERSLSYMSKLIPEVVRYDNVQVDADTRRQLMRLKNSRTLPAPNDAASRKELAQIMAKMEGIYGKGKFCRDPKDCQDLGALMKIMAEERNYDKLLEAWKGWRTISPPMRDMYQRFVDIANHGAKDSGFSNVSALWKAGYEMDPDAFEGEIERLWNQVKPLYEQLHCDV